MRQIVVTGALGVREGEGFPSSGTSCHLPPREGFGVGAAGWEGFCGRQVAAPTDEEWR